MSHNLEELKVWATPVQAGYIDAILEHGSVRSAARAIGKHHKTLQKALKSVQKKAQNAGYNPEHGLSRMVPPPFVARGHSTLDRVFADGRREMVLQWTKTRREDKDWLEDIQSGIESFVADMDPVPTPALPPKSRDQDIIPWIQIGDAHLGMLAHEAETGANFDLKIAERELLAAIFMLIDQTEPTERLVINDLGDFTHYENMRGETEASGNVLDFDGRFPKMIDVYAKVMRAIIDKALTKAQYVDVIVNQGNHSRTNDIWMAVLIKNVYGRSGRVNVLNNHTPFIGYRMGRTFVMTHHSDTTKPAKLAHVMSTDFARDWGETDYRYIDIGHIHHNMVLKEHPGVVVESWNILAPKDKWAHDYGYRARQSITVVERSRSYGEKLRRPLSIREVQDAIHARAINNGDAPPYRPPEKRAFTV